MRKSTEILLTPFVIFMFLWAVVHIVWTDVIRPRLGRISWTDILVLALFLFAQIADGVLTYMGLSAGVSTEANPLLAFLIPVLGTGGTLVVAKLLATAGGLFLFWTGSHRILAALTVGYFAFAVLPWTLLLLGV